MSFGKKLELNFQSSNYAPLLEENVTSKVNAIHEKVFELNKIHEDVKDFCLKLNKLQMNEYALLKPKIYNRITDFPKVLNDVQQTISAIRRIQINDRKLEASLKDQIRIIEERIINKNQEFRKNVDDLVDKEKIYFNNYKSDSEIYSNASSSRNDFEKINESQIILQTVVNNREYMELRDKELAEIKKISGQILSQTEAMSADVQKQKEALGSIEDMVIDVRMNANLAENEIKDAEKMTRSSSKKIFWLSMILLFVIISLIVIVVLLLLPGDKKLE